MFGGSLPPTGALVKGRKELASDRLGSGKVQANRTEREEALFQPVEKSRAYERVVEQIEQAIYSCELQSGEHLPSERALAEQFQVGRSTVREALRILESRGLLRTLPGSPNGPLVSPSNTAALSRSLHGVVRAERICVADLVQYRMISGSAANFLAAHLHRPEHLADMAGAIQDMMAADPDDNDTFAKADARFHQAVRAAAANSFLDVVSGVIEDVIVGVMTTAIENSADRARTRKAFVKLHRELYSAIKDGDAECASDLAKDSLFQTYAPLLEPEDQARLRILLSRDPVSDARRLTHQKSTEVH